MAFCRYGTCKYWPCISDITEEEERAMKYGYFMHEQERMTPEEKQYEIYKDSIERDFLSHMLAVTFAEEGSKTEKEWQQIYRQHYHPVIIKDAFGMRADMTLIDYLNGLLFEYSRVNLKNKPKEEPIKGTALW